MNLIFFGKITFIRTHFFRIIADFEADNENDTSSMGKIATNLYKQTPILNGCYIVSELNDILKSGLYESPL